MGMLSFGMRWNRIVQVSRGSRRGADGFLVWKSFIASGACVILDSGPKSSRHERDSPSSGLGIGVSNSSFVSLGSRPPRTLRLLRRSPVVRVVVVVVGGK